MVFLWFFPPVPWESSPVVLVKLEVRSAARAEQKSLASPKTPEEWRVIAASLTGATQKWVGLPWENHRKIIGKPRESQRKIIGKP